MLPKGQNHRGHLGRTSQILDTSPHGQEHNGYLTNYLNTGERKIIGIGREVVGRRKDGRTFPMSLEVSEMRLGAQRMFTGIVRDITERKRAEEALQESILRLQETLSELKATQQQVLRQERLAAMGQLAAGIAHDFNNILTGIVGFAQLLWRDRTLPASCQKGLKVISEQGERGARLVQQILDFSRQSPTHFKPLDPVPLLKETTKLLEHTLPEYIHVELEIESGEYLIKGEVGQL